MDRPAPDGEEPGLAADGTGAVAGRAGLLLAQAVGLSLEEVLEGALVEAGGGGLGDLLHEVQVGLEPGPVVAEGPPGDDLTPPSGEVTELLELFGGKGPTRHGLSCLGVRATARSEFWDFNLPTATC